MTERILKALRWAWLGVSLAACGSTAEVNEEAVRAGHKDVDLQAVLARFKDVRVVGSEDGLPYALTGRLGQLDARSGLAAGADGSREALEQLAPLFGLEGGDLVLRRVHRDERGHRHLRFQQTLEGLRVVGGELVLHADETGALYALNGHVRADAPGSAPASVSPEAARAVAVARSSARGAVALGPAEPVFVLTAHAPSPQRAYEVRVTGEREGLPVDDLVYVDARRGDILLVNPRVHSALNRQVYSANNTTTPRLALKRSEGQAPVGDPHVDTNYDMLGATYNCYKTLFTRDSYDNAGATLLSTVHYDRNYVNAYWDGTQMVYGDGDGVRSAPLGLDLDVTVHELTHAVTDTESKLIYSGESGGLNEALSDIFAGVCESWTRGGALDADVFKIGEDIWTPGTPGDALRYLDDPSRDGASLDFYGDYVPGVDVHYSSGIANLAFALLSKGGTHPRGKSSTVVPGIGTEKAGRIFYKANTDLFVPGTTFEQAKVYTVQAAEALYGAGSAEAAAVTAAWQAVGVPPPPPVLVPLSNGVALTGLSGSTGSRLFYTLEVPAGQATLTFDLRGGTGDADLYVRRGAVPSMSTYDCRSYTNTNTESCVIANPAAGTWYVLVSAFTSFSGASLKGAYVGGGGGPGTPVSLSVSGSLGLNQQAQHGPYAVLPGTSFKVVMTGSGDPDLYVRFGAKPTTLSYHCRPYLSGASESCELTVPADQKAAYVMVNGYSAASTYSLAITYVQP